MKTLFKVPDAMAGDTGMYMGGGFIPFTDDPEHGRVAAVDVGINTAPLGALGFTAVPAPTPAVENGATD